jgi:hypothetical protein
MGEGRELAIVRIRNIGKTFGVRGASEAIRRTKELCRWLGPQRWDLVHDALDLSTSRIVPYHAQLSLPHGVHDLPGCAPGIEARRDKNIGIHYHRR